jgi:hypothetical protein
MSPSGSGPLLFCTLSPRDYDTVLFDLYGLLARAASVRAGVSDTRVDSVSNTTKDQK